MAKWIEDNKEVKLLLVRENQTWICRYFPKRFFEPSSRKQWQYCLYTRSSVSVRNNTSRTLILKMNIANDSHIIPIKLCPKSMKTDTQIQFYFISIKTITRDILSSFIFPFVFPYSCWNALQWYLHLKYCIYTYEQGAV